MTQSYGYISPETAGKALVELARAGRKIRDAESGDYSLGRPTGKDLLK